MKRFWLAALAAVLVLAGGAYSQPDASPGSLLDSLQVAQAQPAYHRSNPQEVAAQIYQQRPDLPLENGYFNREGTALPEDTLVSRLIRYHLYIKNRPPNFRFDWKLTLADYLGAFEPIRPERYPGSQTLATNAAAGDIAAIESLSREQRNQLVLALFQAFTIDPTDRSTDRSTGVPATELGQSFSADALN